MDIVVKGTSMMENAHNLFSIILYFTVQLYTINLCCKRKKRKGFSEESENAFYTDTELRRSDIDILATDQLRERTEVTNSPPPQLPRVPRQAGIAAVHDPNYQTLAGIGQDIFVKDRRPPAPPRRPQFSPGGHVMAGTHDPNYQTLAGIGGDIFGEDKKIKGRDLQIRPPQKGGIAGVLDPNYQTLAGIGADIFGEDKKFEKSREPFGQRIKPPAKGGMAGVNDPNYQTLAGINADIFGADKKAGGDEPNIPQVRPPARGGMAETLDPNYQTLAALGNDIFGEDKKRNAGKWITTPQNDKLQIFDMTVLPLRLIPKVSNERKEKTIKHTKISATMFYESSIQSFPGGYI